MNLLFVLGFLCAAVRGRMILDIPNLKVPLSFQRSVMDNQICKGNFKLETPIEGSLKISIFSEDYRRVFHKEELKANEEVNFSFNTTVGQTYTIKVEENAPVPETNLKLFYDFTSQHNTFDKKVAKREIIDPAMSELTKIEKLLYDLSLQSNFRRKETTAFSDSINEIVISILGINFVMFIAFTGILAYQMVSFKDFLKKKKLI
ncbi:hypothetical protein NECID01_0652 [Nematocida sp. AWRm77]|nr:hypothetical protein NECID01_0652 [Nematocida sp. AWRm77]